MKKRPILVIFFILTGLVFLSFFLLAGLAFFGASAAPSFLRAPIAIVKIEGPIYNSDDALEDLQDYLEDDEVKVVILRLDSPGGAVGPSQEIYEHVKKLRDAHKKVVVSMGTVAASGAYYIAVAADKIVANAGTITGSIGVIMESFGVAGLTRTLMIEPRIVKSGQFKDVGSPFRELTDQDKAYLQNITDDMYAQFVEAVATGRGIPLEKMPSLAEGRIFTGKQAKEAGLVDELGNLYTAIDLAKSLAGLPKDAKVSWPEEPTPFERFFTEERASLMTQFWQDLRLMLPLWKLNLVTASQIH